MTAAIVAVVAFLSCVLLAAFAALVVREMRRMRRLEDARRSFPAVRERLEATFFQLASQSGKPRGLMWEDCDFGDEVLFARDLETKQITALVGVTIRFSAVVGGDLEYNPNVANLRAATAVFQHDGRVWTTQGRALFNLQPAEALQHFAGALEPLNNAKHGRM